MKPNKHQPAPFFSPQFARARRLLPWTCLLLFLALPASVSLRAQANLEEVSVGNYPTELTVNTVTNKVYVVNRTDGTVSVIDGASNGATTVKVGNNPKALAVNPVTNKVYVVNSGDDTISVIDGASNNDTTLPLRIKTPIAIAVNTVTNKIYVVNETYISQTTSGYYAQMVSVIDGASNAITYLPCGGDGAFIAMAMNMVTNKVYIAYESYRFRENNAYVWVIDGTTNTFTLVTVGAINAMAINPATNKIYVANSGTVSVIDGASNNVTTLPQIGKAPTAIAVNPVTNKIYVVIDNPPGFSPADYGTVSVIDGVSNGVTTVTVGKWPRAVTVNPVTNKVYVANSGDDTISVIDGTSNCVTTFPTGIISISVNLGNNPVAVNSVTNKVYVVNDRRNTVSVINGGKP